MSRRRKSNSYKSRASGFTLAEVLVSMAILTVGLVGVAALIGSTEASGTQATYMNMANILASDKLDSLNKWPSTDPNVAPGGSLTGPATCAAGDAYCDQVILSQTSGANYETQTQIVDGTAVTSTLVHTSSGCVGTPASCGVPDSDNSGSQFTRRWLITLNPTITSAAGAATTVTGARRVTVVVTLNDQSTRTPVTFQLSMVRP